MPVKATIHPREQDTYGVVFSLTDMENNPLVPNPGTLFWSLIDFEGNIIDNLENQPVTSASTFDVLLTGPQLAIGQNSTGRKIHIYCRYNSTFNGTLRTDLYFNEEYEFNIQNLLAVQD